MSYSRTFFVRDPRFRDEQVRIDWWIDTDSRSFRQRLDMRGMAAGKHLVHPPGSTRGHYPAWEGHLSVPMNLGPSENYDPERFARRHVPALLDKMKRVYADRDASRDARRRKTKHSGVRVAHRFGLWSVEWSDARGKHQRNYDTEKQAERAAKTVRRRMRERGHARDASSTRYRVVWIRDDRATRGVVAPGPLTLQEAQTIKRKTDIHPRSPTRIVIEPIRERSRS